MVVLFAMLAPNRRLNEDLAGASRLIV